MKVKKKRGIEGFQKGAKIPMKTNQDSIDFAIKLKII
jgi:hypothetical protein